jgi:CheY-like chemotaxis protein
VVNARDAPRQIVADPARLRQVLLNLLGNAVKFTDAGGVELRILAGAAPGSLRIEIADTGRGIDDASRDRLFQDFERLDAATSVEGTGLGLAIAARIVKMMGGTIDHRPNTNGGSVFWFERPAGGSMLPSRSNAVPVAPSTCGRLLLVVDDIEMNRAVVGGFLGAAGHSVELAESGKDAVRRASEHRFDLILMDVRMPEMDGLEATRRIRALPGPANQVPILALTANAFPEQIAQCLKAGMDGHVAKPVDYATLIRAIDNAIASTPPGATKHRPGPREPDIAEPPLRFDRAILERTLAFLRPEDILGHLQSLRARTHEMLHLLDLSGGLMQQTEAAHGLASVAGMFGFTALSAMSRRFERGTADLPRTDFLAGLLRGETDAALAQLEELMRESGVELA